MNKIFISCYSSNFENYHHLLECIDAAGDVGAELGISPEKPGFNTRLTAMRKYFENIPVSFHGPFEAVEATGEKNTKERAFILQAYEEAFDICRLFNAKYIVMHTNQIRVEEELRKKLMRNSLDTIRVIAELAQKKDVRLLVENVGEPLEGSVLFNEDAFISIFNEITNIGALFDVGHALVNGWDMEHVLSELKGKIEAYHIHSNYKDLDDHLPIGEGDLDIRQLCSLIKRYTPDADLVLEYAPQVHVTPQLYKQHTALLKELLA